MKITRNNYEEYFLDFVEGNLEPGMKREFERFLETNPDLRLELDEFENVTMPDNSKSIFNRKSSLKKEFISVGEINEFNYENFLVGKIENDLSAGKLENLETFISENPFVAKEQDLFSKAILLPDEKIVFPNKSDLKKSLIIPLYWRQAVAAIAIAASILLLLYLNMKKEYISPGTGNEIVQENNNSFPPSATNSGNEKSDNKGIGNDNKSLAQSVSGKNNPKKKRQGKNENMRRENSEEGFSDITIDSLPLNNISLPLAAGNDGPEKTQEPVAENISPENSITEEREAEKGFEKTSAVTEEKGQNSAIKNREADDSFTFREFLAYSFKKNVLKENVPKKKKEAKIHPIDFASAAVRGASRFFGSKVQLKKQYKDNGELASVSLISPQFEVSRTLNRK